MYLVEIVETILNTSSEDTLFEERKMKAKKIGLIGRVADGVDLFDGQTVSTRLWRDEFDRRLDKKVFLVDTYEYKKNALKILFNWAKCMFSCTHIVIMLSGNGLNCFLPLLYYSNKIFHRKIFHRVIGGQLDQFVLEHPKTAKYLDSFDINWVQSNKLVEKLNELGIHNAEYLENFRRIEPINQDEICDNGTRPCRFFTFSRVTESKGIGTAIEIIARLNKDAGEIVAQLDVYGPIEEPYKDSFELLMEKYGDFTKYKGSIPSSQAVSVIKDYYFHLFPTTWSGEGFPGTLLDCYNAAIPTIASDWAYNNEYIRNGETGYLYDWRNKDQLFELIKKVVAEPEKTLQMRCYCLEEAKKYNCDTIMKRIIHQMEL